MRQELHYPEVYRGNKLGILKKNPIHKIINKLFPKFTNEESNQENILVFHRPK